MQSLLINANNWTKENHRRDLWILTRIICYAFMTCSIKNDLSNILQQMLSLSTSQAMYFNYETIQLKMNDKSTYMNVYKSEYLFEQGGLKNRHYQPWTKGCCATELGVNYLFIDMWKRVVCCWIELLMPSHKHALENFTVAQLGSIFKAPLDSAFNMD